MLRWGILGTGRIARQFAAALRHSRRGRLVAVGSRAAAQPGIAEFAGARWHQGYDALLADAEVEAVHIATPHPLHADLAIRAAAAGKHILCEKPLAMDAAEAEGVIAAARQHGVFLMEAFMYRVHPQTLRIVDLLRAGAIGEPRLVQASFGYWKPFDAAARHFAPELGGGAIRDVGGYCASMARLVAGIGAGRPFLDPETVQAMAITGPGGVDEVALATLRFPGGMLAQLSAAITLAQENAVRIIGAERQIEIASPWFCCGKMGGRSVLRLSDFRRLDGPVEEVPVETPDWLYAIEADAVAEHLRHGQVAWPGMRWDDTLGNMRTLDAWRAAAGLA
jgi:predicted dehydrogenase